MKTRTRTELTKIANLLHLIANPTAMIVCGYLSACDTPPTLKEITRASGLDGEEVELAVSTLTGLDVLMKIEERSRDRATIRLIFNPAMPDVALSVIHSVWFEWFDTAKFSIPAATAPVDIEKQETAVFPAIGNFPIHHCTGGPEMVTFPPGTNVYPPLESLDTSPHVVVHTKSQLL